MELSIVEGGRGMNDKDVIYRQTVLDLPINEICRQNLSERKGSGYLYILYKQMMKVLIYVPIVIVVIGILSQQINIANSVEWRWTYMQHYSHKRADMRGEQNDTD